MSEWQPIETAPKDVTELLLWTSKSYMTLGYWSGDELDPERGASGWVLDYSDGAEPTHWMPLPEPPQSGLKALA